MSGQSIRVEIRISVPAIAAGHRHGRHALAVLIDLDGFPIRIAAPNHGQLRTAPGEGEIASRGHQHRVSPGIPHRAVPLDDHIETSAVGRIISQPGPGGKGGRHRAPSVGTPGIIPGHHHEQGRIVPAPGRRSLLAPIEALEGEKILIAPPAPLTATGEILVNGEGRGNGAVSELPEEIHLRRLRKIVRRTRLVESVGVDDRDPFAQKHPRKRRRPIATKEVVVVVAHHVAHRDRRIGKGMTVARIVHPREIRTDVPLDGIEHVVRGDPHPGLEVSILCRRCAEMLAEEQGVVPRHTLVEHRVAVVVPVAETAGDVELLLDRPVVAGIRVVLVRTTLLTEKVRRNVLHGIQPEPIRLHLVDEPPDGTEEHAVHILRHRVAHVVDPVAVAPGEGLPRGVRSVDATVGERLARLSRIVLTVTIRIREIKHTVALTRIVRIGNAIQAQILERLAIRKRVDRISLAVRRHRQTGVRVVGRFPGMAHARPLREIRVLLEPVMVEGGVRAFLGDVPGEGVAVEHLPFVVEVRPVGELLPIRPVPADMEIFRDETRHSGQQGPGRHRIQRAGGMRHDVVEINPQPEPVRRPNQTLELGLGAVKSGQRSGLFLVAQIKPIEGIEPHGISAGSAFERWRQPKRIISRLREFGQPALDVTPRSSKVLQDHLPEQGRGQQQEQRQGFRESRHGYLCECPSSAWGLPCYLPSDPVR